MPRTAVKNKKLPKRSSPTKASKTKRPIQPHEKLLCTVETFLNDLESAHDMFDVIVPTLKDQDEKRRKDIDKTLAALTHEAKAKEKSRDRITRHVKKLIYHVKKLHRANDLFRSHALVCMVSQYDYFLADVLKNAFAAHPERITTPDKSLTYDELLALGNLDNVLEAFIAKEIDELLRGPHAKQINYLDDQFKLGIKEQFTSYGQFIELTERRNLFVHSGGVVNKHYLKKCRDVKYAVPSKIKEGSILSVPSDYFQKAYECLFELAVRISYALAVRIYPDNTEDVHSALLNNAGFPLLVSQNWQLAESVFDFALSWPEKYLPTEETRRYHVINYCIAMKELNKKEEVISLLGQYDWSSQSSKFLLAVAVLKEDWKEAQCIMSEMNGKKPFSEEDFRDWPLFISFRNTKEFKNAFRKIYGKKYAPSLLRAASSELKKITREQKSEQTSARRRRKPRA